MDHALKSVQEVIIPGELATGRREWTRVGSHLTLERESEVIRVAKIEVAREINILEDLHISAKCVCVCLYIL